MGVGLIEYAHPAMPLWLAVDASQYEHINASIRSKLMGSGACSTALIFSDIPSASALPPQTPSICFSSLRYQKMQDLLQPTEMFLLIGMISSNS
jgi:hypothetical protein